MEAITRDNNHNIGKEGGSFMSKVLNKLIVAFIAIAIAFGMAVILTETSFATTTMTSTSYDYYHNYAIIQSNGSYQDRSSNTITNFTVKASQANSYYSPIGFNSQQDAQSVVWTSSDTSIATVPSTGTAVASVSGTPGTYDSKNTITLTGTAAGSCTIKASFDGGYVNYTVILEKEGTAAATSVRVIVEDYENGAIWDDTVISSVSAPDSNSAFKGNTKLAAQTFPTAARAAEEYATSLEVAADGSYIAGIDGVGSLYDYTDSWGYGVYRQNNGVWELVDDSQYIGATDFQIKSGDVVFWFYADYSLFDDIRAGKEIELNL